MSLRGHIYSQGPKDEKAVRHGALWGVVVALGEQEAHVCPKCIGGRLSATCGLGRLHGRNGGHPLKGATEAT